MGERFLVPPELELLDRVFDAGEVQLFGRDCQIAENLRDLGMVDTINHGPNRVRAKIKEAGMVRAQKERDRHG